MCMCLLGAKIIYFILAANTSHVNSAALTRTHRLAILTSPALSPRFTRRGVRMTTRLRRAHWVGPPSANVPTPRHRFVRARRVIPSKSLTALCCCFWLRQSCSHAPTVLRVYALYLGLSRNSQSPSCGLTVGEGAALSMGAASPYLPIVLSTLNSPRRFRLCRPSPPTLPPPP